MSDITPPNSHFHSETPPTPAGKGMAPIKNLGGDKKTDKTKSKDKSIVQGPTLTIEDADSDSKTSKVSKSKGNHSNSKDGGSTLDPLLSPPSISPPKGTSVGSFADIIKLGGDPSALVMLIQGMLGSTIKETAYAMNKGIQVLQNQQQQATQKNLNKIQQSINQSNQSGKLQNALSGLGIFGEILGAIISVVMIVVSLVIIASSILDGGASLAAGIPLLLGSLAGLTMCIDQATGGHITGAISDAVTDILHYVFFVPMKAAKIAGSIIATVVIAAAMFVCSAGTSVASSVEEMATAVTGALSKVMDTVSGIAKVGDVAEETENLEQVKNVSDVAENANAPQSPSGQTEAGDSAPSKSSGETGEQSGEENPSATEPEETLETADPSTEIVNPEVEAETASIVDNEILEEPENASITRYGRQVASQKAGIAGIEGGEAPEGSVQAAPNTSEAGTGSESEDGEEQGNGSQQEEKNSAAQSKLGISPENVARMQQIATKINTLANIVSGATQIGSGAAGIKLAEEKYHLEKTQAESTKIEGDIQQINTRIQNATESLGKLMQDLNTFFKSIADEIAQTGSSGRAVADSATSA